MYIIYIIKNNTYMKNKLYKQTRDVEEVYNEVIQEYSEILQCDLGGDDIQEIITNLVDLVIEFSDYNIYKLINLEDYTVSQLMDYEYLKIQMNDYISDYNYVKKGFTK
tara:strand:- start:1067 stop:1390 length:324 start_codon:yes stop_codon:yes gene_type:complete